MASWAFLSLFDRGSLDLGSLSQNLLSCLILSYNSIRRSATFLFSAHLKILNKEKIIIQMPNSQDSIKSMSLACTATSIGSVS